MRIDKGDVQEFLKLAESTFNKLVESTSNKLNVGISNLQKTAVPQFKERMSGIKEGVSGAISKSSQSMEDIIAKIRGLPTQTILKIAIIFILSKFGINPLSSKENQAAKKLTDEFTALKDEFTVKLDGANKKFENLGLKDEDIDKISSTVVKLVQEKQETKDKKDSWNKDAVIERDGYTFFYNEKKDSFLVRLSELGKGTNKTVYHSIDLGEGKMYAVSKIANQERKETQLNNVRLDNLMSAPKILLTTTSVRGEKSQYEFTELHERGKLGDELL